MARKKKLIIITEHGNSVTDEFTQEIARLAYGKLLRFDSYSGPLHKLGSLLGMMINSATTVAVVIGNGDNVIILNNDDVAEMKKAVFDQKIYDSAEALYEAAKKFAEQKAEPGI